MPNSFGDFIETEYSLTVSFFDGEVRFIYEEENYVSYKMVKPNIYEGVIISGCCNNNQTLTFTSNGYTINTIADNGWCLTNSVNTIKQWQRISSKLILYLE